MNENPYMKLAKFILGSMLIWVASESFRLHWYSIIAVR